MQVKSGYSYGDLFKYFYGKSNVLKELKSAEEGITSIRQLSSYSIYVYGEDFKKVYIYRYLKSLQLKDHHLEYCLLNKLVSNSSYAKNLPYHNPVSDSLKDIMTCYELDDLDLQVAQFPTERLETPLTFKYHEIARTLTPYRLSSSQIRLFLNLSNAAGELITPDVTVKGEMIYPNLVPPVMSDDIRCSELISQLFAKGYSIINGTVSSKLLADTNNWFIRSVYRIVRNSGYVGAVNLRYVPLINLSLIGLLHYISNVDSSWFQVSSEEELKTKCQKLFLNESFGIFFKPFSTFLMSYEYIIPIVVTGRDRVIRPFSTGDTSVFPLIRAKVNILSDNYIDYLLSNANDVITKNTITTSSRLDILELLIVICVYYGYYRTSAYRVEERPAKLFFDYKDGTECYYFFALFEQFMDSEQRKKSGYSVRRALLGSLTLVAEQVYIGLRSELVSAWLYSDYKPFDPKKYVDFFKYIPVKSNAASITRMEAYDHILSVSKNYR